MLLILSSTALVCALPASARNVEGVTVLQRVIDVEGASERSFRRKNDDFKSRNA